MSNALLELIARGESGQAGYDAYNRGTYRDAQGREHIRGPAGSIDFSEMTLGQVQDRQSLSGQDENRLFAVGKYQIIPTTMNAAAASLNLSRDEAFTPELQDRIFSEYLIVKKRPAIHDYIVGQPGATLEAAQRGLALEWASFGDPDKNGLSHYGGANRASITLEQSATALNQMREEYQAAIGRGLSPQDAWRAVTATDGQPAREQGGGTTHTPQRGTLRQGDRGDAVSELQAQLNALGYRDAKGHELKTDKNFGPSTRHAVEAFQRDHHLTANGVVDAKTLGAINEALQQRPPTRQAHQLNDPGHHDAATRCWPVTRQAPQLNDPGHPDHAMFMQALAGVHRIDASRGRTPDAASERLAAALVVEARQRGLERIDHVELDNGVAYAVQSTQGALDRRVGFVETRQAAQTPVEQSTQTLDQMNQQRAQAQTQTQAQAQDRTQAPPEQNQQSMGR
jgi:hypothetical protein